MKNINLVKKMIKKQLNEESYYRLDDKVIGNELYTAMRSLTQLYNYLNSGNDLDMNHLDAIIEKLQKVKKSAKLFN